MSCLYALPRIIPRLRVDAVENHHAGEYVRIIVSVRSGFVHLHLSSVTLSVDDLQECANTLQTLVCQELRDPDGTTNPLQFPRLQMTTCRVPSISSIYPYTFVAQCRQFRFVFNERRHDDCRLVLHAHRLKNGWLELRGRDQQMTDFMSQLASAQARLSLTAGNIHTLVLHNCRHYRTCISALNAFPNIRSLHLSANLPEMAAADILCCGSLPFIATTGTRRIRQLQCTDKLDVVWWLWASVTFPALEVLIVAPTLAASPSHQTTGSSRIHTPAIATSTTPYVAFITPPHLLSELVPDVSIYPTSLGHFHATQSSSSSSSTTTTAALFPMLHTLDMGDDVYYTAHVRNMQTRGSLEYAERMIAVISRSPALRTLVLPADPVWDEVHAFVCRTLTPNIEVTRRASYDTSIELDSEYSALQYYPLDA
jgi:hypothetical protein